RWSDDAHRLTTADPQAGVVQGQMTLVPSRLIRLGEAYEMDFTARRLKGLAVHRCCSGPAPSSPWARPLNTSRPCRSLCLPYCRTQGKFEATCETIASEHELPCSLLQRLMQRPS